MTDERAVTTPAPPMTPAVPTIPAVPTTTGRADAEVPASGAPTESSAITADGAYRADALRIVRGTANAEELAALVAALLLTRRAHEQRHRHAAGEEQYRPAWPRDRYTAPGSWAAGS